MAKAKRAKKAKKVKPAARKAAARSARKPVKKAKPAKKVAARKAQAKARPAARASAPAANPLRALAQRIVEVTMGNDDAATLGLYADDVVSTEMGQPPTQGLDAIRAKFEGWRSMVSEAHFEPQRICVDGNTIIIEWLGDVTLAASGKKTQMREVAIHEIRDGKIVREAYFYDPAALS